MHYLAKFCRICIQTGGDLVDIDSIDYDSVKFSEKLKICTQMVITRESLSTHICSACINKLRVSYQFHSMCRKSTTILQQYLSELLNISDEMVSDKLILTEFHMNVSTKLPKPRRKRIGKEERCSLLRKLLSKVTREQIVHNTHINSLTKLCNSIPTQESVCDISPLNMSLQKNVKEVKIKNGGLRNLLNFTKEFDFGYDINLVKDNYENLDLTPLEQLVRFTENFFCDHFLNYKETIINIGDNLETECSDEEIMFDNYEEEAPHVIVKEEVVVESNVAVKTEYFDEIEDEYQYTSRFVQACYHNNNQVIKEEQEDCESEAISEPPISQNHIRSEQLHLEQDLNFSNRFYKYRTLSPYSVKCRTRGNPFISPQLKKQFQTLDFKCAVCNRRFKTPGYLKAHCSRLKH